MSKRIVLKSSTLLQNTYNVVETEVIGIIVVFFLSVDLAVF